MGVQLHFEDPFVDGEVHFIASRDPYVERVLCFPRDPPCSVLEERAEKLSAHGFIYLLETGALFQGLRIVGKGYSAVLVLAKHRVHGLGLLKLRRVDSRRASLRREGELAAKAWRAGCSPRIYLVDDDYVFREYLPRGRCRGVSEALKQALERHSRGEALEILSKTLRALRSLDAAGLDHRELNRPGDHLLYCDGAVYVIDWESGREAERPSNISAFVGYLLYRFEMRENLRRELGYEPLTVLEALRKYKREMTETSFTDLLTALGL